MEPTAKQAFAKRLVEAMLDKGLRSTRNAKSGVDVGPLAKVAKVSREMARRYTTGSAMPDPDKMQIIARWLEVRVTWLRDGEKPKRGPAPNAAGEPSGDYEVLTDEAQEIGRAWSKLSPDTRSMVRDVIFMLVLGEKRYPWLRRGRPQSEGYDEWEQRQVQNFAADVLTGGRKPRS